MGAGANLVRWDGRDDNSETSPDGLYIISVEAMGQRETKTISVVR
jgi:flagellar hook assembly protein FlgD